MSTKIEWAEESWNPIQMKCTKVSDGCKNCYALKMLPRLQAIGHYPKDLSEPVLVDSVLEKPSHWRKPRRVFVESMGDLFHESVPDKMILAIFMAIARSRGKGHTFMILTKRPLRMKSLIDKWINDGVTFHEGCTGRLPSNLWLGVTAENQEQADKRIPILLKTPAAKLFVSIEPMLEYVDLGNYLCDTWIRGGLTMGRYLDWVIVGCESGQGRRRAQQQWFTMLTGMSETPLFIKQMEVDGKLVKMPEVMGKVWDQIPES